MFDYESKTNDKNSVSFHPLEFSDYSFYSIDQDISKLKIFFSIDGSQFMYDKESEKKYVSDIEIIFQVLEKDSGYESSRKVKEISFLKENFYQIKSDNLHKGEIEFDLESNSYQVNIKIIDIKVEEFGVSQLM